MDQVATLTTGWEPDTPVEDSVVRQFAWATTSISWSATTRANQSRRPAPAPPAASSRSTGFRPCPPTAAAASTGPARPAVLLASDDGRGIYRRLGFLDLVRFTIWEHQPAKPGESERRQTDDHTRHRTRRPLRAPLGGLRRQPRPPPRLRRRPTRTLRGPRHQRPAHRGRTRSPLPHRRALCPRVGRTADRGRYPRPRRQRQPRRTPVRPALWALGGPHRRRQPRLPGTTGAGCRRRG